MQSGLKITTCDELSHPKKWCWLHVPLLSYIFYMTYLPAKSRGMNTFAIYCICKSDIYGLMRVKYSSFIFFVMNTHHDKQYICCKWYFLSSSLSLLSQCYSVVQSSSLNPECFYSHLAFFPTQISAKTIQLNNMLLYCYVLIKRNYLNIN